MLYTLTIGTRLSKHDMSLFVRCLCLRSTSGIFCASSHRRLTPGRATVPGANMLRKPLLTFLTVAALCLANATVARGATIPIVTSDSGTYDQTGFHDPT